MRRAVVDPRFAARLRELRAKRELSLRRLADRVFYSKSLIGALEHGTATPTLDMAKRLDDALQAAGSLAELVTASTAALGPDDADRLSYVAHRPRKLDAATVDTLAVLLAGQRRLEDVVGSAPMLPVASAQLTVVGSIVVETNGRLRPALVTEAAQWAQFVAWLNLAGEEHVVALALLDRALEWAVEADDAEMVATVLSFKGHSAWLRREPGPLVGLTEAALRDKSVYVGQRAYDTLQLARGQGLVGDVRDAMESLAAADDLIAETAEYTGAAPPWHYYRTPGFFIVERGLVHAVLGQHDSAHDEPAVNLLRDGLAALDGAGADWAAAYACHLVEVHQRRGDRKAAAGLLERIRRIAAATQSSTLAAHIAALSRT